MLRRLAAEVGDLPMPAAAAAAVAAAAAADPPGAASVAAGGGSSCSTPQPANLLERVDLVGQRVVIGGDVQQCGGSEGARCVWGCCSVVGWWLRGGQVCGGDAAVWWAGGSEGARCVGRCCNAVARRGPGVCGAAAVWWAGGSEGARCVGGCCSVWLVRGDQVASLRHRVT